MKAKVNEQFEYDFTEQMSGKDIDIIPDGAFMMVRIDGINYRFRLVHGSDKSYEVEINNRIYRVKFEDELDLLIKSMGLKGKRNHIMSEIKSPMPGLVFKIMKQAGDTVIEGETLLILEAMKMENSIKSPNDGVIKEISVVEGQAVEKGSILLSFE